VGIAECALTVKSTLDHGHYRRSAWCVRAVFAVERARRDCLLALCIGLVVVWMPNLDQPAGSDPPSSEGELSDQGQLKDFVPTMTACGNLPSDLAQLIASPDRAAFAAEHGIEYTDNWVRVTLRLTSASAPLPSRYALVEQARFADAVEVLASVDDLCSLALDPAIASIELPQRLSFNSFR
jgi:hypothetical protein